MVSVWTLTPCCLDRSLRLFWDLAESPSEEEHVQTYMWLGRSYKDTGRSRDARACYELGLLIALHTKNLHGESRCVYLTFVTWRDFARVLLCVGTFLRSDVLLIRLLSILSALCGSV